MVLSSASSALLASIPTDARSSEQWSLRNIGQNGGTAGADIDATSAWDVTKGSTRITVAVMDTGVDYTHRDLYKNIWLNQGEIPSSRLRNLVDFDYDGKITFRDLNDVRNQGIGKITDLNANGYIDGGDVLQPMIKDAYGNDTGRGGWADGRSQDGDRYIDDLVGWNFVANNNRPLDDQGHGTHVAGIIGATQDTVGITGVAPTTQLMCIKFLGYSSANDLDRYVEALNYAVAHGAKISSNSWTGATYTTPLYQAMTNARNAGLIFVAAAGNSSLNNDIYPDFPAGFNLDNVVSVAATDRYDRLASYSNYGPTTVDIAAPGSEILSTIPNGGYERRSGTSMATPHVSGVMALVWSQRPEWTARQVINQVLATADRLPSLAGKVSTQGRLNAAAAVGAARIATVAPKIISLTRNIVAGQTSTMTVRFDKSMLSSSFTSADIVLTGPNGQVIPIWAVKAIDSANTTFLLSFTTPAPPGTYSVRIGTNVTDAAGTKMALYTTTFYHAAIAPATTSNPLLVTWSSITGTAAGVFNKIYVVFNRAVKLTTFISGDVVLTGPNGVLIPITSVKPVDGSGNKTFEVMFANQTKAGSYGLKIGPYVTDEAGVSMSVYTKTLVTPKTISGVSTVAVNVPNKGRGVSMITLNEELVVGKVQVKINLTHPYIGDLYIHLQGPDGTDVVVQNQQGGSADNMVNATFDLGGALVGKNAKGTWKLWIEDRGGHATGKLQNWSLVVTAKS
jgi:subtilisin family serine protease/subtilisin-like proprotein convertase family protein